MEPQRSPNDDHTRYRAQYWNGPEAGQWLVHEHRYERMAVAALLARWTLGYAGLYYVVGLRARRPEALTAPGPAVPADLAAVDRLRPRRAAARLGAHRRGRQPLHPRGRHRPRRHDRDPGCRPARRQARRSRRSRRPHPAGRRPPLRRPRPPRLTNPGTGGTTMPRHHHTSSRGGRHRRAVLVTELLRRLVGRRRQHRWHRPHYGGQSRARGRWAQPSRRPRRRGRLRARWSR
jgi:hypothetical protein